MANFVRLRPPLGWVFASTVSPAEFEEFDDIRPKLINAADGSTHACSSQIILGGAGLWVSGPSRLDDITEAALDPAGGTFTVSPGATLTVAGGAADSGEILVTDGVFPGLITLEQNTVLTAKGGATIHVDVSAIEVVDGVLQVANGGILSVSLGGTVIINNGATLNSVGTTVFSSSTWPQLSPARPWNRRSLTIAACTGTDQTMTAPNGSTTPDAWKIIRLGNIDQIFATSTDNPGANMIIEFADLPHGATMAQVDITCIGSSPGTGGMTFPSYQIIRWTGTVVQTMSAIIPDSHVLADWNVSELTTAVPVTSLGTIDRTYRYGLRVYLAHHSPPAGQAYYTDCKASGTAGSIQVG